MSETINYQNVANLPVLEEATENTYVIVEDNGEFRRMSGDNLGGGGVKTAIIRDSEYLNAIAGLQTAAALAPTVTYECVNMTFEEAWAILMAGEPLAIVLQAAESGSIVLNAPGVAAATLATPMMDTEAVYSPAIGIFVFTYMFGDYMFNWTADGIALAEV